MNTPQPAQAVREASDEAIAQAFRESKKRVFHYHEEVEAFIDARAIEIEAARALDAAAVGKGGDDRTAEVALLLADFDGMDEDSLHTLRWSCDAQPEPLGDAWCMDYLPRAEAIVRLLAAAPQPAGEVGGQSWNRENLGIIVRDEWMDWAREQPNPKPSWLTPWPLLTEPEREVDRRIGERIAKCVEVTISRPTPAAGVVSDAMVEAAADAAWYGYYANEEDRADKHKAARRILEAALTPTAAASDDDERCESGDPECGPVEFHDVEGVPLCKGCWEQLAVDAGDYPGLATGASSAKAVTNE